MQYKLLRDFGPFKKGEIITVFDSLALRPDGTTALHHDPVAVCNSPDGLRVYNFKGLYDMDDELPDAFGEV